MKSKHKTPDELRDWMGRIYDRCEVLESTPMSAASDAKATNACASHVQRIVSATPSPVKPSSESPDVKKIKVRADGDLHSLLGQMRGRCEVLGSTHMTAASDAEISSTCDGHTPRVEVSLETVCAAASPAKARFEVPGGKKLRDDGDLHSWMAQMRGRCTVLESNPSAATADAASYDVSLQDAATPGKLVMAGSTASPQDTASHDVSLLDTAKTETFETPARAAPPLDVYATSYDASRQDAAKPETFEMAASTTPVGICRKTFACARRSRSRAARFLFGGELDG